MSRSNSEDDERSLVERSAHDLLNPVSSILGFGETLKARGASLGDETIRTFGDSLARQAVRLGAAIRDIGLASRLLRDDLTAVPGEIGVADLLGELSSDRVTVSAPDGLVARADPDLLADALGRLVANALEFSEGEVIVRAGGDTAVWIEVVDRGTGFDVDGLANAFDPLSPGTNAKNERGPGVGLGLFIARRLVEVQGGRLTATSTPGEGSVFRVELPS